MVPSWSVLLLALLDHLFPLVWLKVPLQGITRLRTRAKFAVINHRQYWSDMLFLTEEAHEKVVFLARAFPPAQYLAHLFFTIRIAFSDGSTTGYGGYSVNVSTSIADGLWSVHEAQQSSTWRELKVVDQVLCWLAARLSGHTIECFSDNQNVVCIVAVGSCSLHSQEGAMSILEVFFQHGIKAGNGLDPTYTASDSWSDSGLWSLANRLDPVLFQHLHQLRGPHTYIYVQVHKNISKNERCRNGSAKNHGNKEVVVATFFNT